LDAFDAPTEHDVWYLTVKQRDSAGTAHFDLTGRISAATAARLSQLLNPEVSRGVPVVVDLAGVDYIGGAGVDALAALAAAAAAAGGSLAVTGLTEPVRLSLDLVGPIQNLDRV
jgi:anti-anti-sigma factor